VAANVWIRKEKKKAAARGHRKRRCRAANRLHLHPFPVSVSAPDLASKKACCRRIRGLSSLSHCPSTPTVSHMEKTSLLTAAAAYISGLRGHVEHLEAEASRPRRCGSEATIQLIQPPDWRRSWRCGWLPSCGTVRSSCLLLIRRGVSPRLHHSSVPCLIG
jgi:hypothetical protein